MQERFMAGGVVFVHATPPLLCRHIAWEVARVLAKPVNLRWEEQPYAVGQLRTAFTWKAPRSGTGAAMASLLMTWERIYFEITEDPSPHNNGSRWSYTPDLGVYYAQIDAVGEVVVNEGRLRKVIKESGDSPLELRRRIGLLLGSAWDRELEPYRQGRVRPLPQKRLG